MKKGFTLTELLATIVIIGILSLVSVPIITSVINDSRSEAYNRQVEYIENAARTYMMNNSKELPDDGGYVFISIGTLKEAGLLLDKDVKNPKNNQLLTGCVEVSNINNKFKY